jgi:hypothetical protein
MNLGFRSFQHKKLSLPDVEPPNPVAQSQEGVSRYSQKKGEINFLLISNRTVATQNTTWK